MCCPQKFSGQETSRGLWGKGVSVYRDLGAKCLPKVDMEAWGTSSPWFPIRKTPSTVNNASLFLGELSNRNRLCSKIVIIAQDLVNLFFSLPFFFCFFKKLPFTIPELVQASPCRSSDGILYMGKGSCFQHWYFDLFGNEPQNLGKWHVWERCAVTPPPTLLGKVFLALVVLVHVRIS